MLISHLKNLMFNQKTSTGREYLCVTKDILNDIIKSALQNVRFDEEWYLDRHQDIKIAISSGMIKSAKDHFINYGYFEGKLPFAIPVDEVFYLDNNPDVRSGIEKGLIKSVSEHFYTSGAQEGRLPSKDFSLFKMTTA